MTSRRRSSRRRLARNSDLVGKVRDEMLKLTVGTGGKPSHRKLAPDWEISFYEYRDDGPEYPYLLFLEHYRDGTRRTQRVPLRRDQVFTRSPGRWTRDCVWRVVPEVIETFAPQIAAKIASAQ